MRLKILTSQRSEKPERSENGLTGQGIVFRKSLHLVFKSINILEDTFEDARESKDEGLSYEL